MSQLLRPEQTAEALGVAVATLADWRVRRIGPAFVRIGRSVRYSRADLDAFIAARRVQTTGVAS